ncbi:hypothetical protein M231_05562 [Tremella mesenterica]|uniref:BTB domain-containing protein n=1 Tax=Tremella mesenterica TaxID=5217 RepID=A0A4Q1BHU9_TREME|nr:hypothetical protein M231_05562 [Tremella mesenterica]
MSDKTAALLTIQDFFNMEIGLKPTDGDAIMVKAHILCSGSTFFRDMLTLPQSSSKGHSDKIMVDLDVTQAILKMIVDMINDKQIPQKPTSAQFFTAIDFCDRYAMDGLRDRFLLKLSDYVEDEPWKCFCIASDHHLPELATGAVSSFAHDSRIDGLRLLSFPAHVAEEAAPNYVAALVRAMYSYSRAFLHAEQRLKSEDWQVVSQHFSKAIRVFDYKIDLVMMMNTGASLPLNIIWIFDVDAAEERDELAHNLMAIDQTTVLAFPEPISERQNSPIIPTYVSITSTGVSDIRSDNMENVQLSPSTAYRPQSTNAARSQEPDQIAMRKTCNISPHVRASSFCHVYSGQTSITPHPHGYITHIV